MRAPLVPSIRYCLDLEAELWGHNAADYLRRDVPQNQVHVEIFKFVHGFYVYEQALTNLLMALRHAPTTTHWATRQATSSLLHGTRQFRDGWFFPLNATSNTNSFVDGRAEAAVHSTYLSAANFAYVDRNHYIEVLNGAFKGTTRWLRGQGRKNAFAGFYDVAWHYSESFRYRDVAVSPYARQNPFFWNLGVRWLFSSLACIIELWLATVFGNSYIALCRQYQAISQAPVIPLCMDARWARVEANNFFGMCP
jgi:hypothetical protein